MPMTDGPWKLPAHELYLHHGDDSPPASRPLCQGDVFADIPLPVMPLEPPDRGLGVELERQSVMLLPHPCQNYHGDVLRNVLVVAPVKPIPERTGFRSQGGHWDRFPLLGLADGVDIYCGLSKACSVPSAWLAPGKRTACLSLDGVSLLSRRLMVCFTRWRKPTHANVRAQLAEQWHDLLVWTTWHQRHGRHTGYDAWKRSEVDLQGPLGTERVTPNDVLIGRTGALMAHIRQM